MKRIVTISLLLLAAAVLSAQGLSERTYITTDRQVYVAGDRVWCSAFCVDAATGVGSDFSSVAYIELHSSREMVCTAKVALLGGRGATVMQLPANLPTGNYKLFAYTAQNKNEEGFDYSASAKTISVYNAYSADRIAGGVEVVAEAPAAAALPEEVGAVDIVAPDAARPAAPAVLQLSSGKDATVSVSVWHDDGIGAPEQISIADFKSAIRPGSGFAGKVIPEYEGEIISGRVLGLSPAQVDSLAGFYAFISTPGSFENVYSSGISKDGSISFFTGNIYGTRDLVCEIENIGEGMPGHFELDSPFVNAGVGDIEKLQLYSGCSDRIQKRGAASQIERLFDADTLFAALPVRENLLARVPAKSYILDDYTRFPTMDEVIVEIVTELRTHRRGGRTELQMMIQDVYQGIRVAEGSTLILLDGVPVFNHQKILSYDPALIKAIDIYPYNVCVGIRVFEGMVNITTFKGNLPSMDFDANVRIVDFQGPSLPVAYTCSGLSHDGHYPDYRQTAYWHPMLDLVAGETLNLNVVLPAYEGRFVVTVEGLSSDGSPIYARKEFYVNK